MSKTPNFKSLDFAETFAKSKNVPEIVFPKGDETEGAVVPSSNDRVADKTKISKPKAEAAPLKRLAVELPAYLVRAISDKAHANDSTIRYVVTQALQKAGFHVAPEDLKEDGRRER